MTETHAVLLHTHVAADSLWPSLLLNTVQQEQDCTVQSPAIQAQLQQASRTAVAKHIVSSFSLQLSMYVTHGSCLCLGVGGPRMLLSVKAT